MTAEHAVPLWDNAAGVRLRPLPIAASRRNMWGNCGRVLISSPTFSSMATGEQRMGKLTAISVKAAMARPGTYQDGDGLFLKVDKRGGASWALRLQRDGKRSDYGLGSAKVMTLADARAKAFDLRRAVKVEGRDLLAERRAETAAKVTFREAASAYHAENAGGWKSKVYARQWLASLNNYAFQKLGNRPTGEISAAEIITVLSPIWQEIPETARQVRNRICTVLDYAHAKGWRDSEAPSSSASLKAGRGLPRQVKERENRKAMPYSAVPAFIVALQSKPSFGRLALELLILTGVRSQEVRLATWDEFDLTSRLWTVPSGHMKRGKAHMVPLSDAAIAVLSKAAALRLAGTDIVFPGVAGKPMSDMTLLKVLRDANEPFHVHGFRSAFTDWAANEGFPDAVVEAALAHKTPDAVQAAYRRTTYLGASGQPGARVKLMAAWGNFCSSGASEGATVVPLSKARAL